MAVVFNDENKIFYLEGKDISYVFRINEFGYAEHLYFGRRIARDDISHLRAFGGSSCYATMPGCDSKSYTEFCPEISFFGTGDYREPTVMVQNPSGDRLCELLYTGHDIVPVKPEIPGMPSMTGGETLILHLEDKITAFAADLFYTVYDDCSVVARHIVYKNNGKEEVKLDRAFSFALSLPRNDYKVLSLYGAWARERQIETIPMHHGCVSIGSKRSSSSATLNPFMGILCPDTTEHTGEAIGVSLVYSSSFSLKIEGTQDGRALVLGGINDFDFCWNLRSGETLCTPEAVIAYSTEGIGGMSRAYHDAYRNYLINPRFVNKPRPIVINNWEGTYFNFDIDKLKAIADGIAGTGVDTFVLDDGWFGARNDDKAGLGDWTVNTDKLEGGLKAIIDYVHSLNMKFGLWVEPEMVNENSDLYRSHPDYAVGAPNRDRCYSRNQYCLDLTRKEVRDYIVDSVNKILAENEIDYVKWDYNRNVTEFFSFGREAKYQKEFCHRYALGLYDICERIVNANPNVMFEGCAGGGARFDPAMRYYFPKIWTSDDSDAEERTRIQYGTSIVYPLSSMSCHVSDVPNHQTGRITSFETRAAIAHLGATGYELDASKFTDEDRERTKAEVDEYKSVSDLVLNGDLYRVDDPFTSNFFTVCVVSKDKSEAEMIAYRRIGSVNNAVHKVKAVGLDAHKTYFVKELGIELRGSTLMNVGWQPNYPKGDFTCIKYHFKEVK